MIVGMVFSAIVVGMAGTVAAFAGGLGLAAALACYPAAGLVGAAAFVWIALRRTPGSDRQTYRKSK